MCDNTHAEMEKMIVLNVRRELVSKINSNLYFPLIADESAGISKKEQLHSFHTVSSTYKIRENFNGMLPCTAGLSGALFRYITDILIRCKVDGKIFTAISFD